MDVRLQEQADKILKELVEISMEKHGKSQEDAVALIKENLGYFAGYYSNETRERVERLFDCTHPYFGKIAEKGPPTPEEAFRMGMEMGEKIRLKKLGVIDF
jgi:delta 1-pyrroline-5-carboxylate dehydrogenase